jgi:hypothetical protein
MKRILVAVFGLMLAVGAVAQDLQKALVVSSGDMSLDQHLSTGIRSNRPVYELKLGNITYTVEQPPFTHDLQVGQEYEVKKVGRGTVDLMFTNKRGKEFSNGYVILSQKLTETK